MKRLFYLFVFLPIILGSCDTEIVYTNYQSNGANFSVINFSTGDTVVNGGLVTFQTLDTIYSVPNNINASHNNVILLLYQPPKEYELSSFHVLFKAFEEEYIITDSPYEKRITISQTIPSGTHVITCDAKADEWLEGSSDNGILQVTVLDSK